MVASEYGRNIRFIPPASSKTFWGGCGALWRNLCFIAPGASNSKFPRGSEALLWPSWGPLEGLLGASWGPLGALMVPSGVSLEAQVVPNALEGHFGNFLGALRGPQGPLKGDIFFVFLVDFCCRKRRPVFSLNFGEMFSDVCFFCKGSFIKKRGRGF